MLKQCENCGKFFGADSEARTLCSECAVPEALEGVKGLTLEEKKYEMARSIVYDQPDISPEALIKTMAEEEVKITLKEIMSYVREGRMELKGADTGVFCEECGKKILSGRLCPTCTKQMEARITRAAPEKVEDETVKSNRKKNIMHTKEK